MCALATQDEHLLALSAYLYYTWTIFNRGPPEFIYKTGENKIWTTIWIHRSPSAEIALASGKVDEGGHSVRDFLISKV